MTAFRKISSIRRLFGKTRWYLSEDCLLAAKQTMYAVEYRRFYLRDLEYILVWPSRYWRGRMLIPAAVLLLASAAFAAGGAAIAAWVCGGLALAWVLLELALGPTARSRIGTTGTSTDMPLVSRTRRADKVLAKIDAAILVSRGASAQTSSPATSGLPVETPAQTKSESAPASIAAATQPNES